jgi:hypothetical protein
MATFTFFDEWKYYQATVANVATDTFKVMLCRETDAPVAATDTVKADLTECSSQGGYAAVTLTTTWVETGAGTGVWRFKHNADISWTASGAAYQTFRYVAVYDDTVATPTKPLVGYWDYGSTVTLNDGETFTVDLDANFSIYTLT